VLGAYGLTWLTVALAAAPAVLLDSVSRRSKALSAVVILAALAALYGLGAARLARAVEPGANAPRIRVVQANIDQKDKWRPENLDLIFDTYLDLTRRPADRRPDLVAWPEGALPVVIDDFLAPGSPYTRRLKDALSPGQTLLLGANHADVGPSGQTRYFNSLLALRREPAALRVTGIYDKYRLVPFGEFLPMGAWATRLGIRSLVHMPEDFTPGPPPLPLRLEGAPPVQPLICYEALFPGFVRKAASRAGFRPAWILNASNDAWFGLTSGPLQHLNIASYRAIEEGVPIVRATPTGVSAVIDAYGRTIPGTRLGLGAFGIIDAPLPPALGSTVYGRFGDLIFLGLLAVSAMSAIRHHVRRPVIS
jgi:apolipoprotein N-acyltransferase